MTAILKAIEYHLPAEVLDNQRLAVDFPEWNMARIEAKLGIRARHIAADGECSSDLGVQAAEKLFAQGVCRPEEIDYLLLCTQSPDYFLPTTACLMQDRLGIPKSAGALDFNLGCSGYVYGLGLAKGLVETGQARRVLLITAETYSKFLHPADRSVRTLFGDAAAATLVVASAETAEPSIGPFVFGTDGSGAGQLIVRGGGMRNRTGLGREDDGTHLSMNGPDILTFALKVVPQCVGELLARSGRRREEIDRFILHQANGHLLECLRNKLELPEEKFFVYLETCGNTVSSSIPIALKEALERDALKRGQLVMLVGFGVGLSWAATLVRWEM